MTFGWINDVAVLVQYLLAVPGVLAIGASLRTGSPRLARLGTPPALGGSPSSWCSRGRSSRILTFEQEIGPSSLGFLVLGAWMVVAAVAGRRSGFGLAGPGKAALAALYLGYPCGRSASAGGCGRRTARPGSGRPDRQHRKSVFTTP